MEQVEVEILGQVITAQHGTLSTGHILRTSAAFAKHLVEDCAAAKYRTAQSAPKVKPAKAPPKAEKVKEPEKKPEEAAAGEAEAPAQAADSGGDGK